MIWMLVAIAVGGALGAVARFLTGQWAISAFGTGFPWGTLIVNVLGSFLIAVFAFVMIERGFGSSEFRGFAITGVLGGFTTFSAFSLDALSLIERGESALAAFYIGGSVLLSVGACLLGFLVARAVA